MIERSAHPDGGWLVKCDGCGHEVLAEIFPDRLVVYDKRHGVRHIAVVPKCELLRVLGACAINHRSGEVCRGDQDGVTRNS
jgi:hypothetical protein